MNIFSYSRSLPIPTTFRNASDQMRQELSQSRLQKCEMSEQLHEVQEELAKWRFQCLRQKCVLIDREMRLEAHDISFESRCAVPVDKSVCVSIDEMLVGEVEGASPDVVVVVEEKPLIKLETDVKAEKEEKEGEEEDCEIVVSEPDPVIDLSSCESSPPGGTEGIGARPPQEMMEPASEVLMDMSIEGGHSLATRKEHLGVAWEQEEVGHLETSVAGLMVSDGCDDRARSKEVSPLSEGIDSEATTKGVPCNLDFLLDISPAMTIKPQLVYSQPSPVRATVVDITATDSEDSSSNNKENVERTKKARKSGVTKLQYKAISNSSNVKHGAKSILVKRSAVPEDNGQRSVHFAMDEEQQQKQQRQGGQSKKEAADLNLKGGVVVKKEGDLGAGPGLSGLKGMKKINIRRIHSRPLPQAEKKE